MPLDIDSASDIAAQCGRRPGEAKFLLQRLANHFPFSATDRIDRSRLRELNDFLGIGDVSPDVSDRVRTMDGLQFEHWVGDLFRRAGFNVEVTQASGDHGVDLWASLEDRLVAVQCKRWDGNVGEPILRDLYGAMVAANAHCACLVTTGAFTAQAYEFAKDKALCLVDYHALIQMTKSPDLLVKRLSC